ncbi:MAG: J domain-containing protein [Deltaproteobacteria bacterium]|nr:J domain-containing protein [Deltaproteobacteria bacterium]
MTAERYPLHWPDGQPRTPEHRRERRWAYKVSQEQAQTELLHDLELMGAKDVILSTNIKLRRDGLPYASQRPPDDPGVAVYWTTESGVSVAIACDRFELIRENMRALGLTVAALRAVDRAGCTDVLEGAYRGWAQLPATVTPAPRPWWKVLGYDAPEGLDFPTVKRRFRELAATRHPDRGGAHEAMAELNGALEQARAELG